MGTPKESSDKRRRVFITGGTGYLGRSLIPLLLERSCEVRALVREGSQQKIPPGCSISLGDALDGKSYQNDVYAMDTFVHLVGVSHPAPWKARLFRQIDLTSAQAAVAAARAANVRHFIYVSVAHPAPVMQAYIAVRKQCEALIRESGLSATILRPWYVLGPGHHWPRLLLPVYSILEHLPATRESASRLGLLTLAQMVQALAWAIEHPAVGIELFSVSRMRELGGEAI